MKLLLVEDDAELGAVVELTLRRAGFWVYRADDGQRALKIWADEAPEVIVTDANLPVLDGFEVVRRIRESDDVPIIMITVRGAEEDMVRGLELGADDYITKPFPDGIPAAPCAALVARSNRFYRRLDRSGMGLPRHGRFGYAAPVDPPPAPEDRAGTGEPVLHRDGIGYGLFTQHPRLNEQPGIPVFARWFGLAAVIRS